MATTKRMTVAAMARAAGYLAGCDLQTLGDVLMGYEVGCGALDCVDMDTLETASETLRAVVVGKLGDRYTAAASARVVEELQAGALVLVCGDGVGSVRWRGDTVRLWDWSELGE